MMKLYQKKNASIEDETVLVQLERRHTLKEDTDEANSDNLRKTVRANSLGSLGEDHSSMDVEAVPAEKKSVFTRRPTVITENELSSSLLYKDRKARINSDDESVEDPRPTAPHEDHDLEPRTLHDPKLKPTPISNQRPRKISSCCWYFTIILVICIACLSVMAGVGGIIYMEYFAIYSEKDIENTNKSDKIDNPSASKGISQHPTHKDNFHQNEPQIPENILKNMLKDSTILSRIISRKATTAPSQNNDIFHNKDLTGSKKGKVEELSKIEIGPASENQDTAMTEHPTTSKTVEYLDASRNIQGRFKHFNIPVSDELVEIKSNAKNQDSLDLKINFQSKDNTIDKTPDENVGKINEQIRGNGSIVTENSNSETEVLDSGEEALVSGRIFNFDEISTLQGIQLKGERVNAEVSFQNLLSDDISLDNMENSIDDNHVDSVHHMENSIDENHVDSVHMENSIDENHVDSVHHMENSDDNHFDSIDNMENSIDNHEDNSFDHRKQTFDDDIKENSLDETEHSIDHRSQNDSLDHAEHFFVSNAKSLSDFEDSSDFDSDDSSSKEHSRVDDKNRISDDNSFEEHSKVDNKNQHSDDRSSKKHSQVDEQNQNSDDSSQLVFIRPIVESKAVPIPLAFLRRIGFDIKNPDSHQPMTAEDMDIKFSLAEALKYLRSLDTENKLPVSREKTITRKASNQTEIKETKLPIKSEREEYLNLLRKQIFEKSS